MLAWRSPMRRCTRRSTSRTSPRSSLADSQARGKEPVVVGATLAVDQHELHGRAGRELAELVADQHGLAEPSQPGDHDAGDLGQPDRDRRAVLGPAQPPRVRDSGAMPDRSTRAGSSSGSRCRPRRRIRPGPCWSARTLTQPQVSARYAGGPLVVGQARAGDGRHGGGHALVVGDELGGWEAVLAGPLVPVAKAESLSEQRPLRRQPTGLPGPLPDGRLLRMPAGLTSPQPPGQETAGQGGGAADQGQQHATGRRGWPASAPPPSAGPQGSTAPGDQQAVTAALDQLAVAVIGQVGLQAAGVPAGGAGRAVGLLQPGQASKAGQ